MDGLGIIYKVDPFSLFKCACVLLSPIFILPPFFFRLLLNFFAHTRLEMAQSAVRRKKKDRFLWPYLYLEYRETFLSKTNPLAVPLVIDGKAIYLTPPLFTLIALFSHLRLRHFKPVEIFCSAETNALKALAYLRESVKSVELLLPLLLRKKGEMAFPPNGALRIISSGCIIVESPAYVVRTCSKCICPSVAC